MTFAWYAHLKNLADRPWYIAAIASWGIALFEYLLQVPANRIGYTALSLGQLKILQEVITLARLRTVCRRVHEGADQARLPLGSALHSRGGVFRLPVARAVSVRLAMVLLLWAATAAAQGRPVRARDLGVPFDGTPGALDAITDVRGVTVGQSTIVRGQGKLRVGQGPVRTGVTAIFPRGRDDPGAGVRRMVQHERQRRDDGHAVDRGLWPARLSGGDHQHQQRRHGARRHHRHGAATA